MSVYERLHESCDCSCWNILPSGVKIICVTLRGSSEIVE